MTISQDDIDESLNNAIENGYELGLWTAEQIAVDLSTYDAAFEDVDIEVLVPFISDWLSRQPEKITYVYDRLRHLVCVPYSEENLHQMAKDLNIKRCWFHASSQYPHYDIPVRRFEEISARCTRYPARTILKIVKERIQKMSDI